MCQTEIKQPVAGAQQVLRRTQGQATCFVLISAKVHRSLPSHVRAASAHLLLTGQDAGIRHVHVCPPGHHLQPASCQVDRQRVQAAGVKLGHHTGFSMRMSSEPGSPVQHMYTQLRACTTQLHCKTGLRRLPTGHNQAGYMEPQRVAGKNG